MNPGQWGPWAWAGITAAAYLGSGVLFAAAWSRIGSALNPSAIRERQRRGQP